MLLQLTQPYDVAPLHSRSAIGPSRATMISATEMAAACRRQDVSAVDAAPAKTAVHPAEAS